MHGIRIFLGKDVHLIYLCMCVSCACMHTYTLYYVSCDGRGTRNVAEKTGQDIRQ